LHPHRAAVTKDAMSTDKGEVQTADDQNINSSEIVNFALFVFLHYLNFYKSYPLYEKKLSAFWKNRY